MELRSAELLALAVELRSKSSVELAESLVMELQSRED
jgi:hypothetical protein